MHTFMGDTPIVTLILVFKAHHYSAHLPYRCVKHTYILKGVQNTPLWVAHQWCAVALVCIAHPDFYSVEHDVVFKMGDSVPSARYSCVCNVLRL